MHRYMLGLIFIAVALIAPVLAAENEPNLCYTTHAGQCQTDTDWQIGWFWANHPPSQSSCDLYQQRFGSDDWGMCDGIDQDNSDDSGNGSADGVSLHPVFAVTLDTSYGSGVCALPPDGVDDDFSYDTSSCATDF